MPSPFEAIAGMQSSNPGIPSGVQGTSIDTLAAQDNAKLAQAEQAVANGQGHGMTGLAGILDTAKPMVKDVASSLSSSSQAIAEHDKNMANQQLFNNMLDELESSGTDKATMGAIRALAGNGSDPEKNKLVWDKYIQKAIDGRKVAEETKKIMTDPQVEGALNQLDDAVSMQILPEELKALSTRDRYALMERKKALKEEAVQNLYAAALRAHPDMTPEATKNFMTWAKAMVGREDKSANASQTSKGVQAAITWAKTYSAMANDALMKSYTALADDPVFTKWLKPENIDKLGKPVPIHNVTEEFLSSDENKRKSVIPIIDPETGTKMSAVRVASDEGIAYATSLATLLNQYVKAKTGGVVTANNIMRYSEDLGLAEFARFSLAAAKLSEGDTSPYTAEGMSQELKKSYAHSNRFINTGSLVQSLHNAMIKAKRNVDSTYATIPEAIREHLDNMKTETDTQYSRLPTKIGDIKLEKDKESYVYPEAYTVFSGFSPTMVKTMGNTVAETIGSKEANKGFTVVGAGQGTGEGNKEGKKNNLLSGKYAASTRMVEYLKGHGQRGGEADAQVASISDRNFGTKDKPRDFTYATSIQGLRDPRSNSVLAGALADAGLHETAAYVATGKATFDALQTMWGRESAKAKKEPALEFKDKKGKDGKMYRLWHKQGSTAIVKKEAL